MTPIVLRVKPAAVPAWTELQAALQRSGPTRCMGRDEWTSDDSDVRSWAAGHCSGCAVFDECTAFAAANREVHGVWAGVDRSDREQVRKAS